MEMDDSSKASPAPSWADDWDPEEFMKLANARFPQSALPPVHAEPKTTDLPKIVKAIPEKEREKEIAKKEEDGVSSRKTNNNGSNRGDNWRSRMAAKQIRGSPVEKPMEITNEPFDNISFLITTVFSGTKVQEYCYSTFYKDDSDDDFESKKMSSKSPVNQEIISSKQSSSHHSSGGRYVKHIDPNGFEIWTFKQTSSADNNDDVVYEKQRV